MTLQAGESVGVHPHVGNGEVYYLLSGSATVAEDSEERILQPGDAEFCADGHTHAIRNHTDAPADLTVAFHAPKACHALAAQRCGKLALADIGIRRVLAAPAEL